MTKSNSSVRLEREAPTGAAPTGRTMTWQGSLAGLAVALLMCPIGAQAAPAEALSAARLDGGATAALDSSASAQLAEGDEGGTPSLAPAAVPAALASATGAGCTDCTAGALAKQWQARVRFLAIVPTGSSRHILPTFPGGRIKARPAYVPEIDFTYKFTDHIGAELILATSRHHIKARGSIRPVGRAAKTWVLPPTLTAQYHFMPYSKFRPYVGAGLNLTIYYSKKASRNLKEAIGDTKVKIRNTVGYAFQAGMDVDLTSKYFMNIDVKYIHMNPKTRLHTRLKDGSILVNRTRTHINPILIGIGFGMRL